MSVNVLIGRKPEPREEEYLKERLGSRSDIVLHWPEDEEEDTLLALLPEAEVFVYWRFTEAMQVAAKQLQLYIVPGSGAQIVLEDVRVFNQRYRPIQLVNEHGNGHFVAQHVLAMLLSLLNSLPAHDRWMREGKWRLGDAEAASRPLTEQGVGLLGYGAINQEVERLLQPFGCPISIYRSNSAENQSLEAFCREVEVLIVAVPILPATTGLVDAAVLKALGQDGIIINVARGPVVDQQALYEALRDKGIAAAGLDVWYTYRPEKDSEGRRFPYEYPFHELENVLLSPHRAASPGVHARRWHDVIENIERYAEQRPLINVIDLERGY